MKYQSKGQCCLCNGQETQDHMIRCPDMTRAKWRLQYINQLRTRLEYLETDDGLINMFWNTLTEWFDTETVTVNKYPQIYRRALTTQTNIGWRQIFMGRLSQDWLTLQGSY